MATKPALDTSVVADEDREPDDVVAASEPTRITPEGLIETLREASRLEAASRMLPELEVNQPYFAVSEVGETQDAEDTTIFVLHEDGDLRPSWLRRVIPLAGIATLMALMSLPVLRAAPSPAPVMPQKTENRVEAQAPPVRPIPSPTVVQLQPSAPSAEESVTDGDAEGDVADQAQQEIDAQRKWMGALERGEARLAAGQYDSAVFSFERAIAYHPDDPRAYAGLAEAHFERGKWRESARAFEEAIARSPNDASLRIGLGRAYEQAEKDDVTKQSDHHAMELPSSNAE